MNRTSTLGLIALVVLALTAGGASLAAAEDGDESAETDELNNLTVGEQISSVMSAQEAEVTSEIERHAFGQAIANADSDEERAEIIANRTEELKSDVDERLSDKEELRSEYKAGNISRAEYVSELAAHGVEAKHVNESVDEINETAGELPEELLEENGVNTTALNTLRNEAANMTGPEVAAVAQTIAGGAPIDIPGPNDIPGQGEAGGGDNLPIGDDDHPGGGPDNDQRSDEETDDGGDENETEQQPPTNRPAGR